MDESEELQCRLNREQPHEYKNENDANAMAEGATQCKPATMPGLKWENESLAGWASMTTTIIGGYCGVCEPSLPIDHPKGELLKKAAAETVGAAISEPALKEKP